MTPKALSREIKFRAWNDSKKDWEGNFSISRIGSFLRLGISQSTEGIHVMQFTGLLDKNGKEIYEGDIIKVLDRDWVDMEKDTKYLIVYYAKDSFILINEAGIKERESNNQNQYNQDWYEAKLFREYGRDRFEIIGNIYENPELLTKENK